MGVRGEGKGERSTPLSVKKYVYIYIYIFYAPPIYIYIYIGALRGPMRQTKVWRIGPLLFPPPPHLFITGSREGFVCINKMGEGGSKAKLRNSHVLSIYIYIN